MITKRIPSQPFLLAADGQEAVLPEGSIGEKAENLGADGFGLGYRCDNSRATLADGPLQSAHIGDDHGHVVGHPELALEGRALLAAAMELMPLWVALR